MDISFLHTKLNWSYLLLLLSTLVFLSIALARWKKNQYFRVIQNITISLFLVCYFIYGYLFWAT